ncbi:beta strand repeat-containing protein [Aurantiacibacter luteus]|uniref:beta strand repeat-containing protein n=1 Tax=Aurantiacibacter luteus TaxID=1581420 RepID=UPI0019D3F3E0|nr:DUF5801 repeats-in-toxin domain-containing protein [Aurantiacibacter luteus]
MTDSDGDTAGTSLVIAIVDDMPIALDNANDVTEGNSIGGNLLTDDDGFGVDVPGADGLAPSGGVVAIVSAGEVTTDTTVDANGNLVITTALGTLTVDAVTGAYTYQSTANSTNADTTDVFTYTIRDGDGDESTATLTIDIDNVGGATSNSGVLVNEAGLPSGSDAASDSEIDADGQITVTNATGPFEFILLSPANGTYGTLTLDPDTGAYTYVLDTPFTDSVTENTTNTITAAESFAYEVRDLAGNLIASGSISVDIVDDVPTATDQAGVSVAEDAVGTIGGNVVTDGTPDTEGADGATVTAITVGGVTTLVPQDGTSASYSNANGTYTIDRDGNWTFDPNPGLDQSAGDIDAGFTYTLTDGDGDFDTAVQPITITDGAGPVAGPPILLTLDDQNLADGLTPAGPDFDSDIIVFTPGSDAIASIVFGTSLANLGGGLTWVRVSDTQITGSDGGTLIVTLDLTVTGNTATVTATLADNYDSHPGIDVDDLVDLGNVLVVATDIDGDTASASVSVSVSDDLPTITATAPTAGALTVDETTLGTDATANFAGLFVPDYNADGPGSVGGYTLGINAGATGLVDVATGEAVVLSLNGGVVEGRTATTGQLVFTVSVDAAGTVELDQLRAVRHADTANPDDATGLAAANLITLTATVTDGDGDTADATANIGGAISFRDDGPSLTGVTATGGASVDETDGLPTSGSSASGVLGFTATYGADGAGTTTYALNVTDANSGLATAVGDFPVTLVQVNTTTIEGRYDGGKLAFTVSIDATTGVVTLTQTVALEHLVDGSTPAAYNDTLNLAGKIAATVTVTDRDGDAVSGSADIGAGLTFYDDGPSVTLTGTANDLVVSDANFAVNDTENYADAFAFDGGTDGTASIAYALTATNGTFSGLYQATTDAPIFLFVEGGAVVGRAGADATAAATGPEVFRVTVDASGNVTLDQSLAVDHVLGGGNGTSVSLAGGVIQLTATITDNDGDTASAALDIGADLTFTDDVPAAGSNATVQLDDDALGGNPNGTGDDANAVNTSGTLAHDFGNDGGTIAFDLASTLPAGFRLVSNGSGGALIQQDQGGSWVTVVTVTLDSATGAYTVVQNDNVLHANGGAENNVVFSLGYVVTDGDGDTASGSLAINVDDDTPVAANDGQIASVDDGASGVTVGTVATLTGNDSYGADGPGSPAITIGTGSLGGTVSVVNGNLVYTSATNVAPETSQTETFNYTITDGDGDTSNAATFTILLTDGGPQINAVAGTVLVDEDGLPGGIANGPGDVAGQVTQVSGTLAGFSYGVDGAGSITLVAVADTGLDTLSGNNIATVYNAATRTLTGYDSTANPNALTASDIYFTLVITNPATGAYTYTQTQPVKHTVANTEDDASFAVTVEVRDAEGDLATGQIGITIDDDSPVTFAPAKSAVINNDSPPATYNLNFAGSAGADGVGNAVFSFVDGTAAVDQSGANLSIAGEQLYIYGNGTNVLTARTLDGDIGYTITINPVTDKYTVDVYTTISNGSELSVSNLTSAAAGNTAYRAVGANSATNNADNIDIILSGRSSDGTRGDINTNATNIGVDQQSITPGAAVRIDFVNNATTDTTAPIGTTGFDYQGHQDVIRFEQTIPTINGNPNNKVTIKVTAIDADDDQDLGYNATTPEAGESFVNINQVVVTDASAGTFYTFLENGTVLNAAGQVVNPGTVPFGVVFNTFSVVITGLDDRDQYEIVTDTAFSAVLVESASSANAAFDLGIFNVTTIDAGAPINVAYDVIGTDRDGDSVLVPDAIDLTLNPAVTPVVLDLDGGGNAFAPLSAGIAYDFDGDGVKTKTAWIAAGSAILAYDANADGFVTDASEFVFGGNGMTDLEAIAARYDSNGDGVLDANDPAYAGFGVWLDSDMDAVSDPGEFTSLADAGIVSIDLHSNGLAESAAGGDVTVSGTAGFMFADGSSGTVSDASFANGTAVDGSMMEALLAMGDGAAAPTLAASTQDLPLAREAMGDVLADNTIDALVDHFSGGGDALMLAPGGGGGGEHTGADFALAQVEQMLGLSIGDHSGFGLPGFANISVDDAADAIVLHG